MAKTIKQSKSHISESEQEILKKSRDDKYEVLAVETLKELAISSELGSLYRTSVDGNEVAMRLDKTTTPDVIYQGWAAPGTLTSAASWKIRKMDLTSGVIITWADGNTYFDNIFNNRENLSYE